MQCRQCFLCTKVKTVKIDKLQKIGLNSLQKATYFWLQVMLGSANQMWPHIIGKDEVIQAVRR